MNSLGKVVLVGAGPGDMGLMTIRGQEYLEKADCIIYDRLLNPRLLSIAPANCEKIFVGKANHLHTVPQDKINELLYEKACKYKLVVRLKGGDPYVFGRGGEEALYLIDKGVQVDVVPGVSSSIAALAAAGIPVTHRGVSKGFQVITAHSKKDALADIDYLKLTDETVTYIFLMGLSHVGEIARGLIAAGRDAETKVAVISNGTTNHQKKVVATLNDIDEAVAVARIDSPAIIVVGEVAKLEKELNFFEQRPLFGKKIFLPVIRGFDYTLGNPRKSFFENELESKLIEFGAEVITACSGVIKPIECDLKFLTELKENAFIVFTSSNGVKAFFWNLFEVNNLDSRAISNVKFACIGQKTASTLKEFGFNSDIISEKQTGEDLALALNGRLDSSSETYWFCQKNTSELFEKNIDSKIKLNKIVCYENKQLEYDNSEDMKEKISTCEMAIFTSGSNATFAIEQFGNNVPKKIISIGPACSKTIINLGYEVYKGAEISSYDGIMELLL